MLATTSYFDRKPCLFEGYNGIDAFLRRRGAQELGEIRHPEAGPLEALQAWSVWWAYVISSHREATSQNPSHVRVKSVYDALPLLHIHMIQKMLKAQIGLISCRCSMGRD